MGSELRELSAVGRGRHVPDAQGKGGSETQVWWS